MESESDPIKIFAGALWEFIKIMYVSFKEVIVYMLKEIPKLFMGMFKGIKFK